MIVHKNPYFTINLTNDYYSISFPTEQVIILPVVEKSNILFIKAIRPVFNQPVIELPAGTVDEGETLEAAALREFREETGINIVDKSRLKQLLPFNTTPSRTAQMLNIYQVNITMDEYEARTAHDDEVAGTLLLTKNQVIQKIQIGEIFVATAIAVCLQHIISDYMDINISGESSR